MALNRSDVAKHAGVFKAREVHIPAWRNDAGDDVVLVRGMTLREFEINQSRADEGTASASVLVRCIIDESGGRLFTDEDKNVIAELPLAQVRLLNEAVAKESGLDPDEDPNVAIKVAVEESGKDSETTPTDGSSSS